MKKLFLVVLAGVSAVVASCQLSRARPSGTAQSFYENLCDGNLDETLKTLSASNPFPPEMLRMAFAAGIGVCKEKGGFKSLEVAEERVEGETAFVRGKVRYGNGSEAPIDMKMYKEGGAWRSVWQAPQESGVQ